MVIMNINYDINDDGSSCQQQHSNDSIICGQFETLERS